jgi:hypothetical protein
MGANRHPEGWLDYAFGASGNIFSLSRLERVLSSSGMLWSGSFHRRNITALDGLSGYGINDSGLIVGLGPRGAASYQNGTIIDLGVLPGFNASVAIDVNNSGVIVGQSYGNATDGAANQGFIYTDGLMSALPIAIISGRTAPILSG